MISIFGIRLLNIKPITYNFIKLLDYLYELTPLAGRILSGPSIKAARPKSIVPLFQRKLIKL